MNSNVKQPRYFTKKEAVYFTTRLEKINKIKQLSLQPVKWGIGKIPKKNCWDSRYFRSYLFRFADIFFPHFCIIPYSAKIYFILFIYSVRKKELQCRSSEFFCEKTYNILNFEKEWENIYAGICFHFFLGILLYWSCSSVWTSQTRRGLI